MFGGLEIKGGSDAGSDANKDEQEGEAAPAGAPAASGFSFLAGPAAAADLFSLFVQAEELWLVAPAQVKSFMVVVTGAGLVVLDNAELRRRWSVLRQSKTA